MLRVKNREKTITQSVFQRAYFYNYNLILIEKLQQALGKSKKNSFAGGGFLGGYLGVYSRRAHIASRRFWRVSETKSSDFGLKVTTIHRKHMWRENRTAPVSM